MNKGTLKTKQINQILSMITLDRKNRWDETYIEKLYIEYQNRNVDDTESIEKLKKVINGKTVLLLASGSSINSAEESIWKFCESNNIVSISANFVWDKYACNFAFFTNFKRWDFYNDVETDSKKIITSNLLMTDVGAEYVVNYSDYAFSHNHLYDNCGIMLMKLVTSLGAKKIVLAGFDGFSFGRNFAVQHLEKEILSQNWEINSEMGRLIAEISSQVPVEFLTPSLYEGHS